jgi:pimeloyl-ACP methyl ester carboxylesterase
MSVCGKNLGPMYTRSACHTVGNTFRGFPGSFKNVRQAELGEMIMKYQEGNIIIDGIKIPYCHPGRKKPPIVLLHGATDDGLCWGRTAQELAEQYDVIMPDAQGHGLSDRLGPKFSFESNTKQAAGLANELGLEKPIIMGHSMGAGTTCNVAMDYPTLPKAIILEDPAWGIFPPKPDQKP